jgi:hypothetical protein
MELSAPRRLGCTRCTPQWQPGVAGRELGAQGVAAADRWCSPRPPTDPDRGRFVLGSMAAGRSPNSVAASNSGDKEGM